MPDLIERGFSKGELGLALSAGLTGLFGYLGGALFTNIAMGYVVDAWGWDGGFGVLIAACLLSIFFVALTWNKEKTFLNLS